MKNFLFISAMCCVLMSCNGNGNSGKTSEDSAIEQTQQKADFTMVDGKLYELKGKVKKLKITFAGEYNYESELSFDEQGKVIFDPNYKVERNSQGQLVKVSHDECPYDDGAELEVSDSYKYDSNGFQREYELNDFDGTSIEKYEYDVNGVLLKKECKSNKGSELYYFRKCVITTDDIDAKGNWTKRTEAVGEYYEGRENDVRNYTNTITREIEYYE